MTQEEAREWFKDRYDATSVVLLDAFHDLLLVGSDRQNLVAPSTLTTIWTRHLLDSAQLIDHAPDDWRHWLDIGSGAGLPGIVVAMLTKRRVTLIEPRRLRVEFLMTCRDKFGLSNVTILPMKAENARIVDNVDIVSARAVAKLDAIFAASTGFTTRTTTYILPNGESAKSEVAAARRSWQGVFHVEQSITDPKSGIVVATGVAPR